MKHMSKCGKSVTKARTLCSYSGCSRTFYHTKKLVEHLTHDHAFEASSAAMVKHNFSCLKCNSAFRYKYRLVRHNKKCGISTRIHRKCYVNGCSRKFYHEMKLIKHLEHDHSSAVCDSTMSFKCMGDFLDWKEHEQSTKFLFLSKQTGSSISG